jgi:hypothetical protein
MSILHESQRIFLIIPHLVILRMRNVSDERCRGNQNTHFMISNLQKSCFLLNNVEKFCRAGPAADVNKVHEHFMLDK